MRIVEVVHGYPPEVIGGTERYVQEITKGLRDRGHRLYVYTGSLTWMEDFTVEAVEREGYELTTVHRSDLYFDRWDKAYNPLVEENFQSYLTTHRPDLVHVHHWVRLTSNLCVIAAKLGIPVVLTLHDLYATCPRFFRMKDDGSYCVLALSPENCLHSAERWLFQSDVEIKSALMSFKADVLAELSCATQVFAPSATHARTVSERLGLDNFKIEVLPHGTLTKLNPAPKPPPGEKLKIVYFSHLYPFKGPKQLIQAFAKMKHRDEAELHLFGGDVLPDFSRELKEIGRGMAITFHGPYSPKDLETFAMDLIVIPTLLAESYSFILDEAAGLGVPVVAFDAGAIPERAGGNVMLCRRGDVDEMANVLDRIAEDRSLLDQMRSAPPLQIMTMEEHLDRLRGMYQEAIKKELKSIKEDRVLEHLKEQWQRREFGFKELIRSEQWEQLVASLRKRIVELEVALAKRKGS